ncbi:MAG: hypothetical protein JWM09_110 [Francisellaceae bacterium]|nr:hypothetical protein [Francisellaceae bacterium]
MLLNIIAVGKKQAAWLELGIKDYQNRFSQAFKLNICLINTEKRTKHSNIEKLKEIEGLNILKQCIPVGFNIALEVTGKLLSTENLSLYLQKLQTQHPVINFMIGGPDGLSKACLENCSMLWSLSTLTLPHGLARLILIEQLYRAVCILNNHPYHRE